MKKEIARQSKPGATWTADDSARLLTCQIVHDVSHGVTPSVRVQTMFRMPSGTVALVNGPIRVDEFRAGGDGTYMRSSGFMFGCGGLGLALLAGSLAANAAGNARRRQLAALDAQAAFRPQFGGAVFVTNTGFILSGADGVFTWTTDEIDAMQVIDGGVALMQGQSTRGPLTWRLMTPWAELIFALWALREHRDHPQLMDGSWLREAWLRYARDTGHDPRLQTTALGSSR